LHPVALKEVAPTNYPAITLNHMGYDGQKVQVRAWKGFDLRQSRLWSLS